MDTSSALNIWLFSGKYSPNFQFSKEIKQLFLDQKYVTEFWWSLSDEISLSSKSSKNFKVKEFENVV